MVCTDAYGSAELFAAADEGYEFFAGALEIGGVFCVRIFRFGVGALFVRKVAWIYAYFFDMLNSLHCSCRQKMYIRNKRRFKARRAEFL